MVLKLVIIIITMFGIHFIYEFCFQKFNIAFKERILPENKKRVVRELIFSVISSLLWTFLTTLPWIIICSKFGYVFIFLFFSNFIIKTITHYLSVHSDTLSTRQALCFNIVQLMVTFLLFTIL